MTNHWADMGNATLIYVQGANPAENHPASMAHINKARAGGGGHAAAKMIVVDPRKTRTALQADTYIRIRPGTDIAFINGVIKYILDNMGSTSFMTSAMKTKLEAYWNSTASLSYQSDFPTNGGTTTANTCTVASVSKNTDARIIVNAARSDYKRATASGTDSSGNTQTVANFPVFAASYNPTDASGNWNGDASGNPTVWQLLKAHVAPYTQTTVAAICGCTSTEIATVAKAFVDNSFQTAATSYDPKTSGYRATTMLYAMGITQHTCGAQNVKSYAVIQTLLGNAGRMGGGINALRGIHNVQGSTDMGLLYGNTIGYNQAQPGSQTSADTDAFAKYLDKLYGNRLAGPRQDGSGNYTWMDAFNTSKMGLQQRGWFNQLLSFFGPLSVDASGTAIPASFTSTKHDPVLVRKIWDLYPKGNGNNHVQMFRDMAVRGDGKDPLTQAAVIWGQNPAVTEPNQGAIRTGLQNLKLLVVVETFATETVMAKRRSDGVTYLIPACSYVEEAGSVVNSGRTLQWRERCTLPKGNSKADMELLLRFAYALNKGGCFQHITDQWNTITCLRTDGSGNAFDVFKTLYGDRYGYTPADASGNYVSIDTVSLTGVDTWRGEDTAPNLDASGNPIAFAANVVTGTEAVCERVFREEAQALADGGTVWLYLDGYASAAAAARLYGQTWQVKNKAKSRDNADPTGCLQYSAWGYAWLVNRRCMYNNYSNDVGVDPNNVGRDQTDKFMGPETCARMFTGTNVSTIDYGLTYRHVHRMWDVPDNCIDASGNWAPIAPHVAPGRFPAHTEPYEGCAKDASGNLFSATWGRNLKHSSYETTSPVTGSRWNCMQASTPIVLNASDASGNLTNFIREDASGNINVTISGNAYVLPMSKAKTLTSIRCVEHFQGGPTTRNNSWNVEAEPVPWVEINSTDVQDITGATIVSGDKVNVITVRGNSTDGQEDWNSDLTGAGWAEGFEARVGIGLQTNQRVGPGVVAIPWHWGDQGLATGSRANDLCIDAGDANTTIPEYKACLCWLKKI